MTVLHENQKTAHSPLTVDSALAAAKSAFNEVIPNEIDFSQLRGKHPHRVDAAHSAMAEAFDTMPASVVFDPELSFSYERFYRSVLSESLATRAPDESTTRKLLKEAGFECDTSSGDYWKRAPEARHVVLWHGSFPETEDYDKITSFCRSMQDTIQSDGRKDLTLELSLNADISLSTYQTLAARRDLLTRFLVLAGNALIQEDRASGGEGNFIKQVNDAVRHQCLISELDNIEPRTNVSEYSKRCQMIGSSKDLATVFICGLRRSRKDGSSILEVDTDLLSLFDTTKLQQSRSQIPIGLFGGAAKTIYEQNTPYFVSIYGNAGHRRNLEALNDSAAFEIVCRLKQLYPGDTTLEVIIDDYLARLSQHLTSLLQSLDEDTPASSIGLPKKAGVSVSVTEEVDDATIDSAGSIAASWSELYGVSVASMLASHRDVL